MENVKFSDFIRMVAWMGFRESRQRGSHRFFVHPQVDDVLNLQPVGNKAKAYQVRQFLQLVERYDLKTPGNRK